MFYTAVGVFASVVVMAARRRYWLDWLGAAVVAAIALAIPLLLIWVV
jgi:hypothetical protein